MPTATVSNAGGNYNATTTWVDGIVPNNTYDVVFTATSGQLTVNVVSYCKTFTTTGWTGIITRTSNLVIVGDCTISATTTFAGNGVFYFQTATVLLTSNGVNMGVVWFHRCLVTLGGALTCGQLIVGFDSTNSLTTNNYNITAAAISSNITSGTSVFNLGSSQISCTAFTLSASAATTVNAGTSKITITGNGATLYGYGATVFNDVEFTGTGTIEIANRVPGNAISFSTLYRTCGANHTDITTLSTPIAITNDYKIIGNSAVFRTLIYSKTYGTSVAIDLSGATYGDCAYVDFRDIDFTGSPDFTTANAGGEIVGGSGDCLGNTGVTLTTGVDCYWGVDIGSVSNVLLWWLETAHTNHRAVGGVNIRPLPQDNIKCPNSSFTGNGKTISVDVPRVCTNVDFTGCTRTSIQFNSTIAPNSTTYGNVEATNILCLNGTGFWNVEGRSNHTINALYIAFLGIYSIGGEYSLLMDGFHKGLSIISGTFDDKNKNVTFEAHSSSSLSATGTYSRTFKKGTGIYTFGTTSGAVIWNMLDVTNLTFTDIGTTVFTQTNATIKTIQSGGKTFNNLTFNNGASSPIVIAGSPTINGVLTIAAGTKAISLTAGTTLTLGVNSSFVNGSTVANPCTIASGTASSKAYIGRASGIVELDKLVITDIQFSIGALWYLGYETIFTRCVGHMSTMQQGMVGMM